MYHRLLQPEFESYELSALVSSMDPSMKGSETPQSHPLDRMAADFASVLRLQHQLEQQLRPELQDSLRANNLNLIHCLFFPTVCCIWFLLSITLLSWPCRVETQLSILLAELEHRGVGIDVSASNNIASMTGILCQMSTNADGTMCWHQQKN